MGGDDNAGQNERVAGLEVGGGGGGETEEAITFQLTSDGRWSDQWLQSYVQLKFACTRKRRLLIIILSLSVSLALSLSLCHCLSVSLSSSSFLVCVPDLDTFCRNCWTIMYSPSLVFFRWVQVCFFFVSSWFFSPTVIRFYLASVLPGKQTERTRKTQSTARWVICSDTLSHWNWRLKTGQQPHVFSLTQGQVIIAKDISRIPRRFAEHCFSFNAGLRAPLM